KRVYVSRQADDTLRCVAALEFLGYDKSIDPKRVRWVEREIHAILPDTQSSTVREVTCAFRPCTPDELPLLGRVEGVENLIVAVGHCRYGFTMAPISGVIITDIIMQKKPTLSIEPLAPSRFTN
ncbi:MAG: NAD(P)/FAD-dependent oxidoreductase, partial [Candidatus Bathyarchaeia archaeon]